MSRATGRRDINKAGGEAAEFPIVCETCLGPNPYVRMSRQELGAECKVCTRPFTVFRWQPGSGSRYKKTEVCQTCSKSRNVCQTCLLDLQFGLPTQVRDTALGIKKQAPTSDINREFYAQNIENALENGIDGGTGPSGAVNFGKSDPKSREMLKKLARNDPYYHRNRPHLCSFFAKGECNRGDACPYRHEMPKEGEIGGNAQQSIRDRYNGTNDPVARRILGSAAAKAGFAPPADTAITSLLLTSVPATHNDNKSLTDFITPLLPTEAAEGAEPEASGSGSGSGSGLRGVVPVTATNCAFLNFRTRAAAEAVANQLALRNISKDPKSVKISYGEEEVGVQWGRSKKPKAAATPVAAPPEAAAPVSAEA